MAFSSDTPHAGTNPRRPGMSLLPLSQALLGPAIPVLCYHQVRPESGMTPARFGSHLDCIRALGLSTISLARLHAIITGQERLISPAVVITFDDCTLDNWVYAVPELLKRNMRGVFFAITDVLAPGTLRPRADQTANPPSVGAFGDILPQALRGQCDGFMNEDEIRALVHDLGMEVYAHSAAHQACFVSSRRTGVLADHGHWSHALLCAPDSPPETPVHSVGSAYAHPGFGQTWQGRPLCLQTGGDRAVFCLDDFSRAKNRLESVLGRPCPFLCLPWGQGDAVTVQAAEQAGYTAVLTLDRTCVGPGSSPERIGRIAVRDSKTFAWLRAKLFLYSHARLASWLGTFARSGK